MGWGGEAHGGQPKVGTLALRVRFPSRPPLKFRKILNFNLDSQPVFVKLKTYQLLAALYHRE